jgi:hypothetical protein
MISEVNRDGYGYQETPYVTEGKIGDKKVSKLNRNSTKTWLLAPTICTLVASVSIVSWNFGIIAGVVGIVIFLVYLNTKNQYVESNYESLNDIRKIENIEIHTGKFKGKSVHYKSEVANSNSNTQEDGIVMISNPTSEDFSAPFDEKEKPLDLKRKDDRVAESDVNNPLRKIHKEGVWTTGNSSPSTSEGKENLIPVSTQEKDRTPVGSDVNNPLRSNLKNEWSSTYTPSPARKVESEEDDFGSNSSAFLFAYHQEQESTSVPSYEASSWNRHDYAGHDSGNSLRSEHKLGVWSL